VLITKGNGKIHAKLENKGEYGMLCGYTDEHSPSTYRIYKPSTKKIVTTRDIRWLHLSYAQWIRKGSNGVIHFENEMIRGQESEASSEVDFVIVREMKKNDVGKSGKLISGGLISSKINQQNKNKIEKQNSEKNQGNFERKSDDEAQGGIPTTIECTARDKESEEILELDEEFELGKEDQGLGRESDNEFDHEFDNEADDEYADMPELVPRPDNSEGEKDLDERNDDEMPDLVPRQGNENSNDGGNDERNDENENEEDNEDDATALMHKYATRANRNRIAKKIYDESMDKEPKKLARLIREFNRLHTYYNPMETEVEKLEKNENMKSGENVVSDKNLSDEKNDDKNSEKNLDDEKMDDDNSGKNSGDEKLENNTEFANFAGSNLGCEFAFSAMMGIDPFENGNEEEEETVPLIYEKKKNETFEERMFRLHLLMLELEKAESNNNSTESEKANRLKTVVLNLKEYVPRTFREAWDHPDLEFRRRFREAIRKEFRSMIERKVWRNMKRRDIPQGRRCVKCKWVFEIKRDGRFKARLVACGYSQIPGIDFHNSYAPTISDVSLRALLTILLLKKYKAKIVDVETAFLLGNLDEDIYMEAPEAPDEHELGDDECVKLEKSMYGLVQSARQYYIKISKALRKLGFKGGYADPCLMMKKNEKGICYIAIWVDDSLLVGDEELIDDVIKGLEDQGFKLKKEDNLNDYLSCQIKLDTEKGIGWIHQPNLIKKLELHFGEIVGDLRTKYKTPGTPGKVIVREGITKVSVKEQSVYRTGVGMLLFLIKHSRPDIANPVRELTKILDGASYSAYKEMKRVIKFVLDTKLLGLKLEPRLNENGNWWIVAYSDSDYAKDPSTRKSVTGFIVYFCGVPVSWMSKSQKSVTLSSSEAEYVALSETAKEIRFLYQASQRKRNRSGVTDCCKGGQHRSDFYGGKHIGVP